MAWRRRRWRLNFCLVRGSRGPCALRRVPTGMGAVEEGMEAWVAAAVIAAAEPLVAQSRVSVCLLLRCWRWAEGGILFRELSEPDGCPSPTEVAMLPAGARAADAISTPGWVAAALLPAGRYALRGGAWHRMLDPAAACAALWRATAAHTLSCGDIVQWPATPAAGLPAAVPRWVAEAGGGSHASPGWVDGEGAAGAETGPGLAIGGPPLLDLDGDGRPELLLRVFIAPGVTSFSIDTCGSASDGRIRLFAGCPWGGGALALSRPLLEDGDSGTVERCRAPLHEVTAEAGAGVRCLSRGNDAVVWSARMQGMVAGGTAATGASPSAGTSLPPGAPLLPGEYWLA
eukprot:scaffold49244_cov191-Isochrysis_galbana.AAC.1